MPTQIMASSIAPSRALLRSLLQTQTRSPARRLLSTSTTSVQRRPTASTSQCQFLEQRRCVSDNKGRTVEEVKSRYRTGPFSWKAGVLFVLTGIFMTWYFDHEKKRMQRKRIAESNKGVGRARVGGPFQLIDQEGRPVSSEDLKGRYSLVYFGFTHCPDICPDELDKMARMYDLVEAARPGSITPVFITCDPERDTPKVLKDYLVEFHPRFLGLTGTYDQIKDTCKAYRVYFSTPKDVKPGQDYLVDHSIYFYLMDPDGDFVEALGRQHSPEEGAKVILDHMKDWKGQWRK